MKDASSSAQNLVLLAVTLALLLALSLPVSSQQHGGGRSRTAEAIPAPRMGLGADPPVTPTPCIGNCCNGVPFDPSTQGCCLGVVYNKATQGCCGDIVYDLQTHGCCAGLLFSLQTHKCCVDMIIPKNECCFQDPADMSCYRCYGSDHYISGAVHECYHGEAGGNIHEGSPCDTSKCSVTHYSSASCATNPDGTVDLYACLLAQHENAELARQYVYRNGACSGIGGTTVSYSMVDTFYSGCSGGSPGPCTAHVIQGACLIHQCPDDNLVGGPYIKFGGLIPCLSEE